jgi:hypothetical protein
VAHTKVGSIRVHSTHDNGPHLKALLVIPHIQCMPHARCEQAAASADTSADDHTASGSITCLASVDDIPAVEELCEASIMHTPALPLRARAKVCSA